MQVYKILCELIKKIDYVCELFFTQNYFEGSKVSRDIIGLLGSLLSGFGKTAFADNVSIALVKLLEYQENEDYIGMADFYKGFLREECCSLLESLRAEGVWQEIKDYYKSNYAAAGTQIQQMLKDIEAQVEDIPDGYELAETSVGSFTLQVGTRDNKKLYLASATNPYEEARILAKYYMNETYDSYILFGFGMGYLATELAMQENVREVIVCEHDKYVIKAAFHYMDLKELLKNKKLKIFYDSTLSIFSKEISVQSERGVIIHRPSMMNIKNLQLRKSVQDFFMYDSSMRNQGKKLIGNFKANTSSDFINNVSFADELKDDFNGKNVLFIAAGPSLEGDISYLKECNEQYIVTTYGREGVFTCTLDEFVGCDKPCGEEYIIVCVGTVLRKLYFAGIKPDYVIMSDPQDNMVSQIEGVDTSDISLIFLSTLYYEVVRAWQGKKYITFQKDFAQAERFAADNSLMLFETGGSVATFAIDLLIRFGCGKVVCVGLDLAYVDNKRHAGEKSVPDEVLKDLRRVKDVNDNMVYTSVNLDNYRLWIENRLKRRTDEELQVSLINASSGAYIEGMVNEKII